MLLANRSPRAGSAGRQNQDDNPRGCAAAVPAEPTTPATPSADRPALLRASLYTKVWEGPLQV